MRTAQNIEHLICDMKDLCCAVAKGEEKITAVALDADDDLFVATVDAAGQEYVWGLGLDSVPEEWAHGEWAQTIPARHFINLLEAERNGDLCSVCVHSDRCRELHAGCKDKPCERRENTDWIDLERLARYGTFGEEAD